MTHAFASGCGDTCNETYDWLFHIGFAPACGFCFVWATDFTDHDDGVGIRVVVEHAHDVDVLQAVDGVATNTDSARLAQANFSQLRDCLISQCTRATHHADATFAVDVARHDTDFDFIWRDQAWTVWAEQQGLFATSRFFRHHAVAQLKHVTNRNAFGDANRQV